jgi:hypothetical protein
MQSEEQIKKTNKIVATGVGIGIVVLGGGLHLYTNSMIERQNEMGMSRGAEFYCGAMNRSVQAFYVEERRFPQNFSELVNKFRGYSSSYVPGHLLEQLENSNMKLSGYEFNMKLVDQDTVHVSAIPLYKGDYHLTVSGGVFFSKSDMQAKGKLCTSQKFTSGSIEFPELDTSGQLTCPSGYEPNR